MKIGKAACAHIGQFRASEQTFLWAFFHQLVTIMTMKRVCNVYNEKTHIPVCCSDFPKMIPNNFLYWYGCMVCATGKSSFSSIVPVLTIIHTQDDRQKKFNVNLKTPTHLTQLTQKVPPCNEDHNQFYVQLLHLVLLVLTLAGRFEHSNPTHQTQLTY